MVDAGPDSRFASALYGDRAVFLCFKGMTSSQQAKEGEETALLRAMLRFNKGKLRKI